MCKLFLFIVGFNTYLIFCWLGGNPITTGLCIDSLSTTQSKVCLVAVGVSAMTLTDFGNRPLKLPIS